MEENLLSKIIGVVQEIKNTNRRIDTLSKKIDVIQKSIDLLDADRELMEDTHTSLREIKDLLTFQRTKQTDTHKEIKAEIQEVKESIDDLPKETEKAVSTGFEGILETVKKSRTVAVKSSWFSRFKKIFTK